jgi:hypothetical protein
MIIPMLDDDEFAAIRAAMEEGRTRGQSPFRTILDGYNAVTGSDETNPSAVWHHIASHYGPDCTRCGKPLRTKNAAYCVACGHPAIACAPAPPPQS